MDHWTFWLNALGSRGHRVSLLLQEANASLIMAKQHNMSELLTGLMSELLSVCVTEKRSLC